jgi:SAM-dependent methyltransferase
MTRKRRKTQDQLADKYVCYQNSVQEPEADIPVLNRIFKKLRGRAPLSMREDFCGTAALACEWVRSRKDRVAYGVDLDPEPLEWGREHNVGSLNPDQQSRVKLIEGDVLTTGHERVDLTCAFNFSYFLFRKREELIHYFRQALATLNDEGVLLLDVYGGPESQRSQTEERDCDGFTYVWEQASFDPINNHGQNYIHYQFEDGSQLHRAFSYEWRIWQLPDLREALADAGFSQTQVYWEGTDRKSGEGNSVFSLKKTATDDPAWIAYIAAIP